MEDIPKHSLYESIKKVLKLEIISQKEDNELKKEKNNFQKLEYKILIMGAHNSGKTSFCLRCALNEFDLEIKSSKESKCYLKNISLFDEEIKVYLIDAFSLKRNTIYLELLKDTKGVIIMYDVTRNETFKTAEKLVKEISLNFGNNFPIILVGNKNDLTFLREIDFEEAKKKANLLNCSFREINCVDENSVHDTFKYLISKIYFNDLDDKEKEAIVKNLQEE